MPFSPFVLGRYNVLTPLGHGGMAEVFLAEQRGAAGFARLVVIKRIMRSRHDDPLMIQMFVDEARLTLSVQHPNVVQVLELQEDPDGLYMVLEYVDGGDLNKLLTALRRAQVRLPIRLACYVVGAVLRGLAYAHEALGADGNRLDLIHRDVTPSNVLLTRTGQVKLSDFGVAKAESRSAPRTEVGGVKGKIAYMAPEMLARGTCDQRSDLFSAGVVLWEALTGQRLFAGDLDYQLLNAVVNCNVTPPRQLRPDVPEALEAVVMRALTVEPEDRFQSARDFERALFAFTRDHHPEALAEELSDLILANVKTLSPPEVAALPRPSSTDARLPRANGTMQMRPALEETLPRVVSAAAPERGGGTQQWVPTAGAVTESAAPSAPMSVEDFFRVESAPARTTAPAPAVSASVDDFFGAAPARPFRLRTAGGDSEAEVRDAWSAIVDGLATHVAAGGGAAVDVATLRRQLLCEPAAALVPRTVAPVLAGNFPVGIPADFFQYARQGQINGQLVLLAGDGRTSASIFITRGNLDLLVMDDAETLVLSRLVGGDDALLTRALQQVITSRGSLLAADVVSPARYRQVLDEVNLQRLRKMESRGPCTFQYFTGVAPPVELPPAVVPFGPQLQGVEQDADVF